MPNTKRLTLEKYTAGYMETGDGDTTLILIHGNSMAKECFNKQLHSSLVKRFRLIAFDLPGHGETVCNEEHQQDYTLPGLKTFIRDVIRELGTDRCILLGHSLGGHIAIETANKLPGVCGVMVWGTPPLTFEDVGFSPFTDHPAIPLIFSEYLDEKDIGLLSKAYWSKQSEPPSLIAEKISRTDPLFRSTLSQSVTAGEWEDEVKAVEGMNCPVALGMGEHDVIVNREYIRKTVEERVWGKKLHIIAGAGHSAHMENPDAFNRWVEGFVEEIL